MAKVAVSFLLFHMLYWASSNTLVFQPSSIIATGPRITALLLGNLKDVSLNVRTVFTSNLTGSIEPPSCEPEETQWIVTKQLVGTNALQVNLQLNKSLHFCGENETDCCPEPLCVLESLQVSACVENTPKTSLLIQAKIHAHLITTFPGSDNQTVIPNQVYEPLGSCPCDLTAGICDIRCCCDKDCSSEELKLFKSHCFLGPFGGQLPPVPDYHCSAQREDSPDWFPFLCVISPPENNPYLGHFYHGDTIAAKPHPSFQKPVLSAPVFNIYKQGNPIFTSDDQLFTIPQMVNGHCLNNAPVAFLENFSFQCVTVLSSCPNDFPLQTLPSDLSIHVNNGVGGDVTVVVTNEVVKDLNHFLTNAAFESDSDMEHVCDNVTLALDYTFIWKGNNITNINLRHSVGKLTFKGSVELTTRYSAVFVTREPVGESNSGNPGYQLGRPVIAGIENTQHNFSVQRTSINLWKPVRNGLCLTAEKQPVMFAENSTSGCQLFVSLQNLTQCDLLRETVGSLQATLVTATYVAKSGNPNSEIEEDWVKIQFENSPNALGDDEGSCSGIPSHTHIHIWSFVAEMTEGNAQRKIQAIQVRSTLSTWTFDCAGCDVCEDPTEAQLFHITSSVTFSDIPIHTGPPKTRFQINFTEYDCDKNDVCWPQLAFPLTKYYTGEPHSQSLAKGLILVFFFIAASVLGTPWRQIRQAWNSSL
ncbi:tectonic-2 [Corythoichthys intestinalis]|uniref:tectonic-2 n=1 Tax=Corythoichthys intestinalis TaxID=161448 RepID=UPI0025A5B134|nr:tectonic-2 [Corythoichthys intestinalis]XP_061803885.1 tectonic-2-like [Nerophis lumbriciformis]